MNGEAIITNWPGYVWARTVRLSDLPQKLFPERSPVLLNDLEAGASGVLTKGEQHGLDALFVKLWTDVAASGPILNNGRTAVLAIRSGFGIALIVKSALPKGPLFVPSALGRLQIPLVMDKDPGKADEWELVEFVSDFHYNGALCPEYEDIANGRELRLAYQFFTKKATGELIDSDATDAADIA